MGNIPIQEQTLTPPLVAPNFYRLGAFLYPLRTQIYTLSHPTNWVVPKQGKGITP